MCEQRGFVRRDPCTGLRAGAVGILVYDDTTESMPAGPTECPASAAAPRTHTRYDRVLGFKVRPRRMRVLGALRERTCVRMPTEPTAIADPSIKHTANAAGWGRRRILQSRANLFLTECCEL